MEKNLSVDRNQGRSVDLILALAAGLLLSLMIHCNSQLARQTSPLMASWIAHAIGTVASLLLFIAFSKTGKSGTPQSVKTPFWAYLGGIAGAITVVLAAITVNSSLGLSSSLALMLVGQILFGLASDAFGWLGVEKRALQLSDLWVVLAVFAGSVMIIGSR